MRKLLVGCGLAAALLLGAGAPVLAGEVTGNGDPTPVADFWTGPHPPRSICAFSGLNDTYSGDPSIPDAEGFTRTQNWGQLPKELRDLVRAGQSPDPEHVQPPNVGCNPSARME